MYCTSYDIWHQVLEFLLSGSMRCHCCVWMVHTVLCGSGLGQFCSGSLVPRPLPDFILQLWRETIGRTGQLHVSMSIYHTHSRQNYNLYTSGTCRSGCTRVAMSGTWNRFLHLLLEYFCDDASAYGPASLPEGESLVHLQGNVVFESECQGCVIARHYHLFVCDTRGRRERQT